MLLYQQESGDIMHESWKSLYDKAISNIKQHKISPFINSGYIVCAILTDKGNLFLGTNIVSNTSLNMCAEKNAIAKMIFEKENIIKKMLIVDELGEILMPCKSCYEYLLDFNGANEMEILVDLKNEKVVKVHDLLPDWWGTFRIEKED